MTLARALAYVLCAAITVLWFWSVTWVALKVEQMWGML